MIFRNQSLVPGGAYHYWEVTVSRLSQQRELENTDTHINS